MTRLPSISLDRCASQSRFFRESAARCEEGREQRRLTLMAEAYESLAARMERQQRAPSPRAHP